MLQSYTPLTLFLIHCFITICEFLPPFCYHRILNYLINCTSQFFLFFQVEPLVAIKNYIGVFSLSLALLKQV
jgi:hypothetical protein